MGQEHVAAKAHIEVVALGNTLRKQLRLILQIVSLLSVLLGQDAVRKAVADSADFQVMYYAAMYQQR
jgi:hypothetical protein